MKSEKQWREEVMSRTPIDDPDDCGRIFGEILNESEPKIFQEMFARQEHFANTARRIAAGLTGADRQRVFQAAFEPFISFAFRVEIGILNAGWIYEKYFAEDEDRKVSSQTLRDGLTRSELEVNGNRINHFEFLLRNLLANEPQLAEQARRIFYFGLRAERHSEGGLVVALKRVPR